MRMMFMLAFVLSLVVAVPTYGTQDVLKGPDGETIALVLDCNSCAGTKRGCDAVRGGPKMASTTGCRAVSV